MECRSADLAYCAGIFDGEGCLSVSPYPVEKDRTRFHCDIFIGMQHKGTLEFFQRTVGTGNLTRRKDLWMFQTSGAKASHICKVLMPYLRTKKVQAALFIEFAATFGGQGGKGLVKPTPADVVAVRLRLSEQIRTLMKSDALAFHSNGVKTVNARPGHAEGYTVPSAPDDAQEGATVYRLAGAVIANTPATSAPPEREEIVGSAW